MTYQQMLRKAKKIKNILSGKQSIESKAQIINWLGRTYNYSSYLEISTLQTGSHFDEVNNSLYTTKDCLNYYSGEFSKKIFDKIQIPDHQIPFMEYDEHLERIHNSHRLFDVILVDPYHTFIQSKKDIETAMQLVSDDGVIIVHDCNPAEYEITTERRYEDQLHWCGRTYESFIDFRLNNPGIETSVVDVDFGCGIIRKNYPPFNPLIVDDNLSLADLAKWDYFSDNRKKILNLISVDEFLTHYQKKSLYGRLEFLTSFLKDKNLVSPLKSH